MPQLTVDNQAVEVVPGATLLDAAGKLGIAIPTMCYLPGRPPTASCMVCVVKVEGRQRLYPACATPVEDGMRVSTDTEEVRNARRAALELLLGDHLGDCIGPCHSVCPAQMHIPRMIRQIAAGRLDEAIATVKAQIAFPAVLGRICHRPCEKGCRRAQHDAAVAICLLKRHVADADLARPQPYLPPKGAATGKKVAIVGAGPAGLSAAYYLLQLGHACTVFDDQDAPGGMLRYGVGREALPLDVLDAEIAAVRRLGAEIRTGLRVGRDVAMADLQREFDAVLVAVGEPGEGQATRLGLAEKGGRIAADIRTFEAAPGVFAAGGAIRSGRHAVRAVADGRFVAEPIDQFLRGCPVTGPHRPFTVHIGRLMDGEIQAFLGEGSPGGRVEPAGGESAGFLEAEARSEAQRCLHCDCRKPDNCKLRNYAELYQARSAHYKFGRRLFQQDATHRQVVYEPGKCISCGICIRLAAEAGEKTGLTFLGRGFDVRVGVPFGGSLAEALGSSAADCVAACPTGALAFKDET